MRYCGGGTLGNWNTAHTRVRAFQGQGHEIETGTTTRWKGVHRGGKRVGNGKHQVLQQGGTGNRGSRNRQIQSGIGKATRDRNEPENERGGTGTTGGSTELGGGGFRSEVSKILHEEHATGSATKTRGGSSEATNMGWETQGKELVDMGTTRKREE